MLAAFSAEDLCGSRDESGVTQQWRVAVAHSSRTTAKRSPPVGRMPKVCEHRESVRWLGRDAGHGTEGSHMTNEVDELGPVDWIVVEFPGSKFNGEIAPALVDLVERGIIRVLDLVLLRKDADGSIEGFELSDLDDSEIGQLRSYEAELALLLSEDDVEAIAQAVDPGTSAAVLVFENTWAAPFASAVRRSGGLLVASGRIPVQALLAAIEADDEENEEV